MYVLDKSHKPIQISNTKITNSRKSVNVMMMMMMTTTTTMTFETVTFNVISKYMVIDTGLILFEDRRGPQTLNLTTQTVITKESQHIQTAQNVMFCGPIAVFELYSKLRDRNCKEFLIQYNVQYLVNRRIGCRNRT